MIRADSLPFWIHFHSLIFQLRENAFLSCRENIDVLLAPAQSPLKAEHSPFHSFKLPNFPSLEKHAWYCYCLTDTCKLLHSEGRHIIWSQCKLKKYPFLHCGSADLKWQSGDSHLLNENSFQWYSPLTQRDDS